LIGVLYLARADERARHRGTVVVIEQSPFAPSARLLEDYRNGVVDGAGFVRRYRWDLRALWGRDREVFRRLIAGATGGADATLVDGWGDEPHAPRRVLAAALRRVVRARRATRAPRPGGSGSGSGGTHSAPPGQHPRHSRHSRHPPQRA
jgi:hypothetical protein